MADVWLEDGEAARERFLQEAATWTQADVRAFIAELSDYIGEYQGLPVPLGGDMPLVLNKDHPLRALYLDLRLIDRPEVEYVAYSHSCSAEDVREDEYVVNEWFSRQRNCRVLVIARGERRLVATIPVSPDRSMDRLTLWLQTLGAADAWDLEAEHKARESLREMLTERQWMQYELTGSFLEESPRSRLFYLFRRLRPTVVLSPRSKNGRISDTTLMRCLAVLCMHPIGYYARSWAGCMVPTDDVIAHLTHMRGDEAGFWRYANQHNPKDAEAGL